LQRRIRETPVGIRENGRVALDLAIVEAPGTGLVWNIWIVGSVKAGRLRVGA
jgi:hypothetical protein